MENPEADCQALLERLYLFVDGEMGEADCAELERHVRDCYPCQGHVDFEVHLKELVRRKCSHEEVPADLLERVRAHLREMSETLETS